MVNKNDIGGDQKRITQNQPDHLRARKSATIINL